MKKILVAYFSASGVTERAAKEIAKEVNGDLFEIRPREPYTEADLDWIDKGSRSTKEMNDPDCRPEIAKTVENIEQYDIVFLGFPVWWYVEPRIVDTFLESYDFSGKAIIPFATSGGSGMGKTNERLAPSCPGATLLKGKMLNGSLAQEELKAWADHLCAGCVSR